MLFRSGRLAVGVDHQLGVKRRLAAMVPDPAARFAALEAVAALDPAYGDVFQRLQAIYIAEGARQELASLLEARLAAVTDPAERVELEVLARAEPGPVAGQQAFHLRAQPRVAAAGVLTTGGAPPLAARIAFVAPLGLADERGRTPRSGSDERGVAALAIVGNIVTATVTLDQPEDPAAVEQRVRSFCQSQLPAFKVPAIVRVAGQPLHNERFKKIRTAS